MSAGQPVMVVEDHDGADHAARHHDHDAGEVGPNQWCLRAGGLHVRHLNRFSHGRVCGSTKFTMFMNIVSDINTVISRVTFSPESGGKLKPSTAMLSKQIISRSSFDITNIKICTLKSEHKGQ